MNDRAEYRQVLRDAITQANRSWTATDTLYASLCAAGIGAGSWLLKDSNTMGLLSLSIMVLALSGSWIVLIRRYRRKLKSLLERVQKAAEPGSELEDYFRQARADFGKDGRDFLAPVVPVFVVSVWAGIYWYGG